MLPRHTLSKSTYLRGCQCLRRLWLYKKRPDLIPEISASQQMVFEKGTDVGLLAQTLFPDGKDASPPDPFHYPVAIQQTTEWINAGETVIYEAAFQYDGVMAALDILVKKKGKWYAYEVKSSTEIKDYQLTDASLQYFVMTGAGLELADISIVHINKEYIRKSKIEPDKLFTIQSVKMDVLAMQKDIPGNIKELKKVLQQTKEPDVDIGPHCADPFPCEFSGHCWSHIPEVSVFDIANLRSSRKFELYTQGIIQIEELPDGFRLTENQQLQVRAYLEDQHHIDHPKIRAWLKGLKYPLIFMDFETFFPAVPLYSMTRPYQHIPFQFSVHVQSKTGGPLGHLAYLGEPETDPRPGFLKELVKAVGTSGSVIVYNKAFEQTRLKELALAFPSYKVSLQAIQDRLADLMEVFRNKWYYLPSMNGSYSIKDVLPALVPELNYADLEIGEGGTAMAAFEGLLKITDKEQREKVRQALLKYCELDTVAMVEIFKRLMDFSDKIKK